SSNTSISGLTAGSYELEISDGSGCTRTEIFVVDSTYNSLLAFSSISTEDDHCATGVGEIDVVAIGSSSYSYFLDGVLQSGSPISGLLTGTYTVTVEDGDGCNIETVETIDNTLTFSSIYVDVSDENCSGTDGIIDIYVSPPSSSYTYSWSNGATTQDVFGVIAGTYSVTIDDGFGCIGTMDTTINNSFSFSSSYMATHEFCSDGTGSIDLSVTGGAGPFDYSWNTGETTEDISGLSANTYVATITNLDDGCIDTISVTINDTIGFTIMNLIQTDSCGFGNGSIDLSLSGSVGPFTFLWSNGETTEDIVGLAAGNYSVVITDQGTGCTKTIDYAVLSSSSYGLAGSVVDASCPTCADGAISISLTGSPTGPFEVLWSTGDTVFNIDSLLPGWYTINVEDALGCSVVDSFEISAPTWVLENDSWNVLIYPNPTNEVFNVKYQVSGAKELNFEIYDIVGQLIEFRRSGSNEGAVRFDLNGEQSGTYYLRVSSGASSKTYRLMLIR
ncbi:MAG: T9SS type A sorting domain-containing protein, partial [Crocinitomicaceae bacterium]|nr:T9SS type A sorting domain-containing protein [Crocinitomicaceae bacterium]